MSVYGVIVTGHHVEKIMREHIQRWSLDYLAEVAEQSGTRSRGDLPGFRSYLPAIDLDKFDEDQVPSCVIVAPGIAERPIKDGNGNWRVRWAVGVGCVVSGQDRDNTFELTQLYAAAVRACVLQHQSLGSELIAGVDWMGEVYDELDDDDARTLAAGQVQFGVDVYTAVDSRGGTAEPVTDPTAPAADWGTVETVDVVVQQRSE